MIFIINNCFGSLLKEMLTLTYLCIRYIRPLDGRFVKLRALLPRKGPLCHFPVQTFSRLPVALGERVMRDFREGFSWRSCCHDEYGSAKFIGTPSDARIVPFIEASVRPLIGSVGSFAAMQAFAFPRI